MTRLSILEHEFHEACVAFREPAGVADEYDKYDVNKLLGAIANTPPASIGGCVTKLRALANRELGGALGDRDDDFTSLRQVISFLEDFNSVLPRLAREIVHQVEPIA